jgi:outer membrane protein OmpA-like peptidoglycan-associated protein
MRKTPYLSAVPRSAWTLTAVAAMMALAACNTTPPRSAQLEEARRIYADASANPEVTKAAQLELERARKALYEAESAWKEGRDPADVSHLSYLATQQSKVALNVGMQHAADTMVTSAGVERERVLAESKTQEAQAARADAQNARMNAQVAQATATSATNRVNALEQELQALQGKQTKRGMVVVLQDVLFDVGKADLKSGSKSRLEKLASVLQNHPERKLQIEGYTDSTGSDELNQTLSEQRAQAVKDALAGLGVTADRIDAKGFGEAKPVASNKTAAGRQQNRRVEVIFSDTQGTFASP